MDIPLGEQVATAQYYLSVAQDSPHPDQDSLKEAALILESVIQSPLLPRENKPDLTLECAVAWAMFGDLSKAESLIKSVLSALVITPAIAAVIGTIAPSLIPEVLPQATGVFPEYLTLLADQTTGREHLRIALNNCLIAGLESNFYFKSFDASLSSFENSLLRSCRVVLKHLRS